jgi:hypothetical protein
MRDGQWTPALRLAGMLLVIALMMIGFGALLRACFLSEPPGPTPVPSSTPGATAPPVVASTWTMAPMATSTPTIGLSPPVTVVPSLPTATQVLRADTPIREAATAVPASTEAPEPAATVGTLPKTGQIEEGAKR